MSTKHQITGITLRELRKRHRVQQQEIAERLGVTSAAVSAMERVNDPQLSTLDAYVKALGGELMIVVAMPISDGVTARHMLAVPGKRAKKKARF